MQRKFKIFSSALAMADIALLLLIFFMVSTSIVSEFDEEIDLPSSVLAEGVEVKDALFSLKNKEDIFFNNQKILLEDIPNILENKAISIKQEIIIQADGKLPYLYISSLIKKLQENQYNNLIFMTIPNDKAQ